MILYDKQYLKYFRYGQSIRHLSEYPSVSLFETFRSNRPFICNYHQTIKQLDKKNILWKIEMNL